MRATMFEQIEVDARSCNNWAMCRLGDLCDEDRRLVDPESNEAAILPYLSLEDIESTTGRILLDPSKANPDAGKSTTFRFDPRHVLYGKLRPYLNKVALPSFAGRCTTELVPLLPRESASRSLVALLLRRSKTVEAAMRGVTGSRMPRANLSEVLAQEVVVPSAKEDQDALAHAILLRLDEIQRAKSLCREQLDLLDVLERKTIEHLDAAGAQSERRNGSNHG